MPFPHKTTHPMCDQHPSGFYNQAKRQGVEDQDIPREYWPMNANVVTTYHQAAA
jgi:hypothetical protein